MQLLRDFNSFKNALNSVAHGSGVFLFPKQHPMHVRHSVYVRLRDQGREVTELSLLAPEGWESEKRWRDSSTTVDAGLRAGEKDRGD